MPRPRRDGTTARPPRKQVLTEFTVTRIKPEADGAFNIWDAKSPGLVLRVQKSGHRAFKFVYHFAGRDGFTSDW
jgi:hypothetical protein